MEITDNMIMNTSEDTKQWVAEQFGILPADVVWYHHGSCYDRVEVTTLVAAKKVAKVVERETANGGFFHGMPLGGIEASDKGFIVNC